MWVFSVANAGERIFDINIPSQNAAKALEQLAEQTGAITLFPYDLVSNIEANSVFGSYTLPVALDELLKDTGLSGGLSEKRVISIKTVNEAERINGEKLMLIKKRSLFAAFAALFLGTGVNAQGSNSDEGDSALEEVLVLGSHIKGTPKDSASPVQVLDQGEMLDMGSPSILEIVRNLGVSAGTDGETNQFGSNNLEGTSNINLRGLGAGRTLVLLNGRRQTFSPVEISDQQMLFVDTNSIPSLAIERLEILKDGAAATYGSDAIAGVVNFITRKDFVGFEISGSYKDVKGSDGDEDIGMIWGVENGDMNWVTSMSYNHRSELSTTARDYALKPFADNPQGGWSSLGNPVSIYDGANNTTVPDPNCNALGGFVTGPICRFQYTFFDNLVEEEERYQVFSEFNYDINETTSMHLEFLYAGTDIDSYKTSPSFPPQVFVDTNRQVPSSHPGWIDMQNQFPQLASLDGTSPDGLGVLYRGRVRGVAGPAAEGTRNTDTYRLAGSLDGELSNGWNFDVGFAWSRAEKKVVNPDIQVVKLRDALQGLGGPNCVGSTPGANGCEYFNPFSNAIQTSAVTGAANPSYNPAVANSAELINWLEGTDAVITDYETELFTLDTTISGELDIVLSGGNVGFAFGGQFRQEKYLRDPNDLSDLAINPCPIPGDTSCSSPAGLFAYLSGSPFADLDQDIFGLYGELALPFSDNLNMQLALRYEDYGGNIGDTVDPKLAIRWQFSPLLALRASASTTFRGPTLNQISGGATTTAFVPGTGAFKAIVAQGNPNLKPESAATFNIGLVGNFVDDRLFASIDYWSFDFDDSIVVEPFADVLSRAIAGDPQFTDQVILSTPGDFSSVERILVNIINGPNIKTSGIDLAVNFNATDSITLGTEFTYIDKYDVAASSAGLFDGFSPVGQLNETNFFRPVPQAKGRFYTAYDFGNHNVNLNFNYVHSYRDERASVFSTLKEGETIDSHLTTDLNYNYRFENDRTRLNVSINNLTDEDPPFARLNLNYDPFTHSPLGRTIKLNVSHRFGKE